MRRIVTRVPHKIAGLALSCAALAAPVNADMYVLPPAGIDLVGLDEATVTRFEDTLPDIARRYGLGYEEILVANPGADPWLPGDGREIVLPTRHILPSVPRDDIVINLPERRLYYFPKTRKSQPAHVISHPISIGQMDWETPLGVTTIVAKIKNPTWYPPKSIREQHEKDGDPIPEAVPPGPDNPLGDYAMRLGIPGGAYLIHGTNRPVGVGMPVTHGCIRMYPEDIESLFRLVKVGTRVHIINQPMKTGWVEGVLYLEVHPPIDANHTPNLTALTRLLVNATSARPLRINWPMAERTLTEARGIPVAVSLPQVAVADTP
jgi:L,D-transpeptidase ErfK/SrfK